MNRTQILLEPELHRRALAAARARRVSLGALVRRALADHLDRLSRESEEDPVLAALTADPYDDPRPDRWLARDVDHYLYGAPRRTRRRR